MWFYFSVFLASLFAGDMQPKDIAKIGELLAGSHVICESPGIANGVSGTIKYENNGDFVRRASFSVLDGELFFPVPIGSGSAKLYVNGWDGGEVAWTDATPDSPGTCTATDYTPKLETAVAEAKVVSCDGVAELTCSALREHPESFAHQPSEKQDYIRELVDLCGCPELIIEGSQPTP
jgi:hypothetical protein